MEVLHYCLHLASLLAVELPQELISPLLAFEKPLSLEQVLLEYPVLLSVVPMISLAVAIVLLLLAS